MWKYNYIIYITNHAECQGSLNPWQMQRHPGLQGAGGGRTLVNKWSELHRVRVQLLLFVSTTRAFVRVSRRDCLWPFCTTNGTVLDAFLRTASLSQGKIAPRGLRLGKEVRACGGHKRKAELIKGVIRDLEGHSSYLTWNTTPAWVITLSVSLATFWAPVPRHQALNITSSQGDFPSDFQYVVKHVI